MISLNYYAEKGCDKTVRENYFPNQETGVVVDVGAAKPIWKSQSRHFEESGWRRICVEPNPLFIDLHKKYGTEVYQFACSDHDEDNVTFQIVGDPNKDGVDDMEGFSSIRVRGDYIHYSGYDGVNVREIKVNLRKLDTILEPLNLPSIDYVCVDTEGWEIQVMKGFSIEKWKPKVILLEDAWFNGENYTNYMDSRGYKKGIRVNNSDQCYVPK